MNNLQNRVQFALTEKKLHKRCVALMTALSLFMVFMMPLMIVMPIRAEDETISWSINSNGSFNGVVASEMPDAIELGQYITSLTVDNEPYTGESPVSVDGDSCSLNIGIAYTLEREILEAHNTLVVNDDGTLANPYLQFKLDTDEIHIDTDSSGSGNTVIDSSYPGIAGYYSISKTGYVTIRLTRGYIDFLNTKDSGCRGTVAISGNVFRKQTEDGNQDIHIGNKIVTVDFPEKHMVITKNSEYDKENNELIWTLVITNTNQYTDLSEITLVDTLKAGNSDVDWSMINMVSCEPAIFAKSSDSNSFTYCGTDADKTAESVVIKYKLQNPEQNVEYSNVAEAQRPNKDTITSNTDKRTIANKLDVKKSGTPDYETGVPENKIHWEVSVENSMAYPLYLVTVNDELDFSTVSDLKVTDSEGSVLTEGIDYEINSGNIKFLNSNAPYKAYITYTSEFSGTIGNEERTITNKVSASSEATSNKPDDSGEVTGSVPYSHKFNITKAQGGATSVEEERIQWKITASVDYGSASLATLDGYVIQDAGFTKKDGTQLAINNSTVPGYYITYNAFYYDGNARRDVKEYVELAYDENGNIVIHVEDGTIANCVELFYNQDFEDADCAGGLSYDDYLSGKEVTFVNNVKGSKGDISKEITGNVTYKIPGEITKEYLGEAEGRPMTVIDNTDVTPRELKWNINAHIDRSIDSHTSIEDSIVSHGVYNSIKPGSIKVYISESADGTYTETNNFTVSYYKRDTASDPNSSLSLISGYDANSTDKATKFEVVFTDGVPENMHDIRIEYLTAMEIPVSEKEVNINNKAKIGDYETYDNWQKFVRKDPTNPDKFELRINKTWNDANNAYDTRPDKLNVKVYRTVVDPASPGFEETDWEIVMNGNSEIFTLNVASNNYSISNLDQWKPTDSADIQRYYYKVVEVLPDDSKYTMTASDPYIYSETGNYSNFNLTNSMEFKADKYAVDADNHAISSIRYSEIEQDEQYYYFKWKIDDYIKNDKGLVTYTDTLPEGAELIQDGNRDIRVLYEYYGEAGKTNPYGQQTVVNVSQNGRTVTFNIEPIPNNTPTIKYITYYIRIAKDDIDSAVDENGNLVNTLQSGSEEPVESKLQIKQDLPPETPKITKGYNMAQSRGKLEYYIDVNPDELKLTDDGYINITDNLDILSKEPSLSGVEVTFDSIKVLPFKSDGVTVDENAPITDYTYTAQSHYQEDVDYSIEKITEGYQEIWKITGWTPGEEMTISVIPSGIEGKVMQNFAIVASSLDTGYDLYNNLTYKKDNTSTCTFTIPENTRQIFVNHYIYNSYTDENAIGSVEVSGKTADVPAYLEVNVPDEQHLRIVYTYNVTGYPEYNDVKKDANNGSYTAKGFQAGDTIAVLLERSDAAKDKTDDVYYKFVGENESVTIPTNNDGTSGWTRFDGERITQTIEEGKTKLVVADLGKTRDNEASIYALKVAPSIMFGNSASFEESNGSESASRSGDEMQVNKSNATIEVDRYPQIFKTDVNDYNINTLASKFKISKYDTVSKKWIYASEIKETVNNNMRVYEFVFPDDSTGYEDVVFTGSDPTEYTFPDHDKSLSQQTTATLVFTGEDDVHDFKLDRNTIYRFIEIEAPEDYLQPSWDKGGFASNKSFVFYYAYGSVPKTDFPTDNVSNIRTIPINGVINITNSNRITIQAKKLFSGSEAPDTSNVKLKLCYSTKRDGSNKKPVTQDFLALTEEELEMLGNDFSFSTEPHLNYNVSSGTDTVTWSQLPTGLNGSPVYYFVEETSYTYNNKEYTLGTDGKYYNGTEIGKYKPVYTGNGTNINGSIIEVENSEGVIVKKTWQDSNKEQAAPPDETGSPLGHMQVEFEVYGTLNGHEVKLKLDNNTLSDSTDAVSRYQLKLPDEVELVDQTDSDIIRDTAWTSGKKYKLSDFTSFAVSEILDGKEELLTNNGYSLKYKTSTMVSDGAGYLEIINTKQAVETVVDVSVEKKWIGTPKNSIGVTLIQTTDTLSASALKNVDISAHSQILNGQNSAVVVPNGTSVYSFDQDIISIENINASTEGSFNAAIDTSDAKKLNLTGSKVGNGTVQVKLADESTATIDVTVLIPTATLSADNAWSETWSGLPKITPDGSAEYHYYVLENAVPSGYTVSYEVKDEKTTITNEKSTSKLYVQKKWVTNKSNYSSLSPVFTVYRSSDSGTTWSEVTVNAPEIFKNEKIWTYTYSGLDKFDDNGTEYLYKIEETAMSGYETSYVNNDGIESGNSSSPIVVVNTELFSLSVEKEWSDGNDNHSGDEQIGIMLHRSTDPTAVPTVSTIAEAVTTATMTTEVVTTTTTTTTVSTTTTTTTEANPGDITLNDTDYYYYPVDSTRKITEIRFKVDNTNGDKAAQPKWYPANSNKEIFDWTWRSGWVNAGETSTQTFSNLSVEGAYYIAIAANYDPNNSSTVQSFIISNIVITYYDGQGSETENGFDGNIGSIPANAIVQLTMTGPANKSFNGCIQGNPGYDPWNKQYSYSGTFDGNGEATITVNITEAITDAEVQLWWVDGNKSDVKYVDYSIVNSLPAPRIPTPPTIASDAPTSQASSTTLGTRRITRMGVVNKAEEIISESNNISSISQALTLFAKPNFTLKAASSSDWISETNGEAKNITVKASNNWTEIIDDLPVYDENGSKYYYWIEEKSVTGYSASYRFNDGDDDTTYCINAENPGNGQIKVLNTKVESESVTLPESGGSGTDIWYITGAVLMMLTAAGYTMFKRRRLLSE